MKAVRSSPESTLQPRARRQTLLSRPPSRAPDARNNIVLCRGHGYIPRNGCVAKIILDQTKLSVSSNLCSLLEQALDKPRLAHYIFSVDPLQLVAIGRALQPFPRSKRSVRLSPHSAFQLGRCTPSVLIRRFSLPRGAPVIS